MGINAFSIYLNCIFPNIRDVNNVDNLKMSSYRLQGPIGYPVLLMRTQILSERVAASLSHCLR